MKVFPGKVYVVANSDFSEFAGYSDGHLSKVYELVEAHKFKNEQARNLLKTQLLMPVSRRFIDPSWNVVYEKDIPNKPVERSIFSKPVVSPALNAETLQDLLEGYDSEDLEEVEVEVEAEAEVKSPKTSLKVPTTSVIKELHKTYNISIQKDIEKFCTEIPNDLSGLTNFFSKMVQYEEILASALETVNKEKTDIEHAIEFNTFNAYQGYVLAKQMQDIRIRRRKIKDAIIIVGKIRKLTINDIAAGQLTFMLKALDERKYEPRVLKDIDFEKGKNINMKFKRSYE